MRAQYGHRGIMDRPVITCRRFVSAEPLPRKPDIPRRTGAQKLVQTPLRTPGASFEPDVDIHCQFFRRKPWHGAAAENPA